MLLVFYIRFVSKYKIFQIMVKLHRITEDFVNSCIRRYEKESPHDVVRLFDPLPNSSTYLLPSVLIWNPTADSNCKVFCPLNNHNTVSLKSLDSWTIKHGTGHMPSPLFLYGIGRNVLVVSSLLECVVCTEPIAAHSDHILKQVNFPLPFIRSYKLGLTMDAFDLIIKSIEGGMFFRGVETMMKKLLESHNMGQHSPEPLSHKSISRKEVTTIFLHNYEHKKSLYERSMKNIRSTEVSLDNTFRSVKGVCVTDGTRKLKQFGSICLIVNQDGLIVGRQTVSGSTVAGARNMWEELAKNNPDIHRIDTGIGKIIV